MTPEEKQLLLIDIYARLPYGIKCKLSADGVSLVEDLQLAGLSQFLYGRLDVIPYLRPMSSMTEEEKTQYRKTQDKISVQWDDYGQSIGYVYVSTIKTYDWLNKNHFDYRRLIEKGLALEATKNMYNI